MTYTYGVLDVSRQAFNEIKELLKEADYQHKFHYDPERRSIIIDMHGIAIGCVEPIAEESET